MVQTIGEYCTIKKQEANFLEFDVQGMDLILLFDEAADRMRIISPICNESDCDSEIIHKAMKANFHSALDARYAISDEVVWAAFIHPLSSLNEELLLSAIQQVAIAKATFGDEFTSGLLQFGEQ